MEHFLETWASENPRLVSEEELIVEVAEKIWEVMERQGFSKADLAEALGSSRSNVTQLLDGSRNLTLRKLANIAFALGMKAHFDLAPYSQNAESIDWSDGDATELRLNKVVPAPIRIPCAVSNAETWTFGECVANG